MEELVQWVSGYIATYGYGALFALFFVGLLGMPVPEETLLVVSGFFVSRGELAYLPTLAVCYLGSISAMTAAYWIGRTLGYSFMHRAARRFGFSLAWYHKTEEWFNRVGKWAIPLGYFIPGVRQWTAYVAGITRLPFRTFALFTYIGGLIWSTLFVTLGWQVGERWQELFEGISWNLAILFAAVFVVIAGISMVQRWRGGLAGRTKKPAARPKEEGSR